MKRHLLVDGRGVPLSLVVSGANLNDHKAVGAVLDAVRIASDSSSAENLCADKGYDQLSTRVLIASRGYRAHIRSRGEEKKILKKRPGVRARRWVVEACHSWLNRFRKLLVRFEKTENSALGLLEIACAIICWRRCI
jgi:putative transposase